MDQTLRSSESPNLSAGVNDRKVLPITERFRSNYTKRHVSRGVSSPDINNIECLENISEQDDEIVDLQITKDNSSLQQIDIDLEGNDNLANIRDNEIKKLKSAQ